MNALRRSGRADEDHGPESSTADPPESMPPIWRAYRLLLMGLAVPAVLRAPELASHRERIPASKMIPLLARMIRNCSRLTVASSFLEHLAIAAFVLRVPPTVAGVVVECGAYRGGSTANLTLVCDVAGRELHVYDSFTGLPPPDARDERHWLPASNVFHAYEQGMYAASLTEVRETVARFGAAERCEFHPGLFEETMPAFESACIAAFIDVDLRRSVETCVKGLWPQLVDGGALFVHEAQHREISSLFFDNSWWRDELGAEAPGLIGAGSGLGLHPEAGYWRSSLGMVVKNPANSAPTLRG